MGRSRAARSAGTVEAGQAGRAGRRAATPPPPPVSAAVVSSRRVSAGIGPEPGATSAAPAWWGATDWVEVEVRDAVREHRDVCANHHVDPDTVVAVARGHAYFADHKTGRDCRPTNARLVELCRVSLSTVQRARRVLEALGLVRRLVQGRSFMTRAERLQAWRRGSSHRKVAAVFALCSRPRRGPKMSTSQLGIGAGFVGARPASVERDTPPGAHKVSAYLQLGSGHLRATTEQRRGRSAPAHTEGVPRKGGRRLDPEARRLAEAVRGRHAWLWGVSARRLTRPCTGSPKRAGRPRTSSGPWSVCSTPAAGGCRRS